MVVLSRALFLLLVALALAVIVHAQFDNDTDKEDTYDDTYDDDYKGGDSDTDEPSNGSGILFITCT
jgi:hypothetical protein